MTASRFRSQMGTGLSAGERRAATLRGEYAYPYRGNGPSIAEETAADLAAGYGRAAVSPGAAQAAERRAEFGRLRDAGREPREAGMEMGLPQSTYRRYERLRRSAEAGR